MLQEHCTTYKDDFAAFGWPSCAYTVSKVSTYINFIVELKYTVRVFCKTKYLTSALESYFCSRALLLVTFTIIVLQSLIILFLVPAEKKNKVLHTVGFSQWLYLIFIHGTGDTDPNLVPDSFPPPPTPNLGKRKGQFLGKSDKIILTRIWPQGKTGLIGSSPCPQKMKASKRLGGDQCCGSGSGQI